jgi:TolB-like protein/Tfp pilus assembly protein PilF
LTQKAETVLTTEKTEVSKPPRINSEIFRNCYPVIMTRSCFRFGSYFFDPEKGVLSLRGDPVAIGRRAVGILELLLSHAGETLFKGQLVDAAWPGIAVEESNLSVQIAALRKTLGSSSADNESWIATVPRLGYRFVGAVERIPYRESTDGGLRLTELPREPSISVLPFANLSEDAEQSYFADGLAEDITTSLSRLRWLVVAARNSSFSYKSRSVDARLVGKELGVRYVLSGNVRREGQCVRIGSQLTDATSGLELWADRFEGQIGDFFALQDRVADRVVNAVEPYLFASDGFRAGARLPDNIEAWGFVMRAMPFVWTWAAEDNETAIAFLRQALQIDRSYARANALMAWVLAQRLNLGWNRMEDRREEALSYARAAVTEDDNDAWGHLALGYIEAMSRRTESAIKSLTASINLNPSFAFAHAMLGMAHNYAGLPDVGMQHIRLALKLSPRDPQHAPYLSALGLCHFIAGRYGEAARLQREAVSQRPQFVSAWRTLASASALAGDTEAAIAALSEASRLQPSLSAEWIERHHPIVRTSDRTIYLDGLRAAGLG